MNQLKTLTPLCFVVGLLLISQVTIGQNTSLPGAQYLGKSVNLLKGETTPGSKMLLQDLEDAEISSLSDGAGDLKAKTTIKEDILEAEKSYSLEMGIEGSYGVFSAKAEMKLSKTVRERSKTKIVIITKDLLSARLSLKSKYLKLESEFMTDLNDPNISPEDLFKQYGTHITLGVAVGGRVTGIFSSKENTKEANESLETSAQASYAGVTVSGSYNKSESTSSTKININENWIIKGGESRYKVALDGKKTSSNYVDWAKSVDLHPGFYAFEELRPIWDLAENKLRQSELEKAFKLLFTLRSLENLERFVFQSNTGEQFSSQVLTVPDGYKILSGGAKVNYTGNGQLLYASYPQTERSWVASHKDHFAADASGKISLYAIAVYDPFDLLSVKIFEKKSPTRQQHLTVSVGTSAPYDEANNYQLVGGGAKVNFSGVGNLLNGSYPEYLPNTNTYVWTSSSGDCKEADVAELTSFAIGIKFKDDAPYSIRCKIFSDESVKGAVNSYSIGVGSGYKLVGGGALTFKDGEKRDGKSGNFLSASYPENDVWQAKSKDHLVSSPARLGVYAIGLKVEMKK